MFKIDTQKKMRIVSIVVFAITLVITIFLAIIAIMFSDRKNAVDFFGSNLYLVKSDAFALISPPSAVIGKKVPANSLKIDDIVIFTAENGTKLIGQISAIDLGEQAAEGAEGAESSQPDSESNPISTAKTFRIGDEAGVFHVITEDSVISKAVSTSRFFGVIISFVTSSAGLLLIAVIPCVCVILLEVLKPILRRFQKGVDPVNKQDEVPTFVPDIDSYKDSYENESGKSKKPKTSAAALRAYKQTLNKGDSEEDSFEEFVNSANKGRGAAEPDLFTVPKPKQNYDKSYDKTAEFTAKLQEKAEAEAREEARKKKPLSSVKLAEAIANINAQKEGGQPQKRELTPSEKAAIINQAMADLKRK